jgi:hypothetical protein
LKEQQDVKPTIGAIGCFKDKRQMTALPRVALLDKQNLNGADYDR